MSEEEICGKCLETIKDKNKSIKCKGMCNKLYHSACYNIKNADLKVIASIKSLKWYCDQCEVTNDIIMDKMNEKFESFKNEMIETMKNMLQSIITDKKEEKISYANIVKKDKIEPVLIVKPKVDQTSNITKEDIKQNVNPASLAVGVSGIKEISKGQVVIKCENEKDRDKIQNKIQEEMPNKYDITKPILKYPSLKIIGIHNEDDMNDNEKLVEQMIEQNQEINKEEEGFHLKVMRKMKNDKYPRTFSLIIQTDPKTHSKLAEKERINIGWSRGKIYDFVNVIRCYKCLRFNHFAKDCKNNSTCYKCGSEHDSATCNATEKKCINCIEAVKKYNINIENKHEAYDINCPCYKRILSSLKHKINYSQE